MRTRPIYRRLVLCVLALFCVAAPALAQERAPAAPIYFPARDAWETRTPEEMGFDAEKLKAAVEWAKQQETDMPRDFSAQEKIFGRPMGPLPKARALTNGVILCRGYIIAEWGDTLAVDPTYSAAKSYLSTLLGLTIDRGLIGSIDEPVGSRVKDGGYDSPHNAKITWRHHATQTSEWAGEMFGKNHTFEGVTEFGEGAHGPRELREPGSFYEYNDVRINRFSLSLLRLWKKPLPDVLRDEIMNPIGASDSWKWIPYDNATVDVEGTPMPSVSGGTRWGGGLWISTRDHARFGLLAMNKGEWNGARIISSGWFEEATRQQGQNKQYGYLWWLNTTHAWSAAPDTAFAAQGAGNNSVWIDPEHSLVVVWRWHKGGDAQAQFFARILGARTP